MSDNNTPGFYDSFLIRFSKKNIKKLAHKEAKKEYMSLNKKVESLIDKWLSSKGVKVD